MLDSVRSSALARRIWRAIAITAALELTSAIPSGAQFGQLPFDSGERLRYRVSVGRMGAVGDGEMTVDGPVRVRGTETLVLRSEIHARFGFVTKTELAESWIDPTRMAALRYTKRTRGTFTRDDEQAVELFPDNQRWQDQRGHVGQSPTTAPLDELSFIYFLRTLPLNSDTVDRVVRHYDPARNPITVRVLGRDTVRTKAGTFPTIIVEMRVKDPRRYGGEGVIHLHLSDDAFRYPVRIESTVPVLGATVLTLESYTRPPQPLAARRN
jgi:uncharacterized protein DUF3108